MESSKTDRGTFIIKKMVKIGTEDVILAFGCLIRSSEMKDLGEWGRQEEVGYRTRAIAVAEVGRFQDLADWRYEHETQKYNKLTLLNI
jgi:hypothetical protein